MLCNHSASAPSDEAPTTQAMLWYQRIGAPVSSNQSTRVLFEKTGAPVLVSLGQMLTLA